MIWRILIIVLTTLNLSACDGQGHKDLLKYVEQVDQMEATNKKPMVTHFKLPVPIKYQASALRSPFDGQDEGLKEKNIATQPLESYPLGRLKFMGTMTSGKDTFAFVLAPDNIIYQVKVGDKVGDQQGVVIRITPSQMDVTEQNKSAKMPTQRTVTLQLKEEQ